MGWPFALLAGLVIGAALTAVLSRAVIGHRLAVAVRTAGLEAPTSPRDRLRTIEQLAASTATSRQQAAESEARLAAVLDIYPQAVLLSDRSGQVVFANLAARRYVQPRQEDAIVAAALRELLAEVPVTGPDRRCIELAGPPARSFDIVVEPLRQGGGIAVAEDVTERRRLEAVRRDFVANISHELKTPVGAMALLAETMTGEDDPELLARLADRLHLEAMRVGRTIDDLLLLSRIEADEEDRRGPADLGHVVGEALARVATMAQERGIVLDVEEPPAGLCVAGDGRQLVSALYNLVDNALKYSEDGSRVTVRTAAVGDHVELSVEDQGIGIPARDLERIFERFYRVDKGRSRRTGGTGLGLAIVRHIVHNHGGEVRVRSREGEGSTFTLVLPRHHAEGRADGPPAAPPAAVASAVPLPRMEG